jgi:hypothetical protein
MFMSPRAGGGRGDEAGGNGEHDDPIPYTL